MPEDSLDVVVPLFNEQAVLVEFHRELTSVCDELPFRVRIIYIDDGSADTTRLVLRTLADRDPRVLAVELTRNFGHQAALTAGLSLADADVVITMDGDGQHPPALIPLLLERLRGDVDVVLTMRRGTEGTGVAKRATSNAFYRLLNQISATKLDTGSADFRAMRRDVVQTLVRMPEYHRFLRGMISWLGYHSVSVDYEARPRLAGSTKYSPARMLKLAIDATFSFSLVPLQLSLALGAVFFAFAAAEAVYVLSFWLRGQQQLLTPGWASLMFMLLVVGGTLMVMLAVVGAYVGYIMQEVKERPVFVIRSLYHAHEAGPAEPHADSDGV